MTQKRRFVEKVREKEEVRWRGRALDSDRGLSLVFSH